MSEPLFSDETLMAYADGELDAAAAARVAAAAEHDPNVRARIDSFRRSREVVRDAIAPPPKRRCRRVCSPPSNAPRRRATKGR